MTDLPDKHQSACGIFDCKSCVHRKKHHCQGCSQGNALLAAHNKSLCAVYACSKSHNISSCADCKESFCPFSRSPAMVCPVRSSYEKKRAYTHKITDHFALFAPEKQETTSLVGKKLDKVIVRLPWYLFAVQEFLNYGVLNISSEDIALKIGVKAWLVRRDLSQFGEYGRAGVGYETSQLKASISKILNLDTPHKIVWIGEERLSADISLIQRFKEHNYHIVAIFDTDSSKISKMIGDQKVSSFTDMSNSIIELGAEGAVIATGADQAQGIADILVASGIKGILNLTSKMIFTPSDVCVRSVDIVAELFSLSYHCGRLHSEPDE